LKVLVTGAGGFVGRNLCAVLRRREDVELYEYDLGNTEAELNLFLQNADIIFHLAGVNRPKDPGEYKTGNAGFTEEICQKLKKFGRAARVAMSSSIQARLDNPYGISKRDAEEALKLYAEGTGAECVIFRFKNLFGKWCRPNYNSVTATFCHNIAHGLPIQISNPANVVELTYIDDVVDAFCRLLNSSPVPGFRYAQPLASHKITLGELADAVRSFAGHRETLMLPDYNSRFMQALYATYLSYMEDEEYGYKLNIKSDNRGSLAEFIKSPHFGQIFVSRTKPGITRGNHFHQTKTEKFMIVQGEGIIRLRHIESHNVIEYPARGCEYRVVDIPPGYTHSIENVGEGEMVTLFWSDEVFDLSHTDTWFEPVIRSQSR